MYFAFSSILVLISIHLDYHRTPGSTSIFRKDTKLYTAQVEVHFSPQMEYGAVNSVTTFRYLVSRRLSMVC